jgi:hypothetical protein
VIACLSSKPMVLSSNHSATKKKKNNIDVKAVVFNLKARNLGGRSNIVRHRNNFLVGDLCATLKPYYFFVSVNFQSFRQEHPVGQI